LGALRQAVSNPAAKTLANAQAPESAPSTHLANSGKSAKLEAASGATVTAVTPATAGNLPAAIPAPGIPSPVASAPEAQPRTRLTDFSTETGAGFTRDSVNPHSSRLGDPGEATETTNPTGNQTTAAAGTPPPTPLRGAPSRDDFDRTEASVPGQTESWAAGEEAPSPGGVRSQADEPIQALAQSQMQTQPGSRGLEVIAAPGIASPVAKAPKAQPQTRLTDLSPESPAGFTRDFVNPHSLRLDGSGADAGSTSTAGSWAAKTVANEDVNRGSTAAKAGASQPGQSPAVPPVAEERGPARGEPTSEQATLRLAHGADIGVAAAPENRSPKARLTSPATDASILAPDPAGVRVAMSAPNDGAGSSAGAASGQAARETFAALDAQAAPALPTWIHAGAQRAEAGFRDPALGWVGVRADLGADGVHASLVPGSADAAQALGGHLAGLNSYLAEQHTPVETLTLAAPEGRWAGSVGDQGVNQGMNQGQGGFSEPQANPPPMAPNPSAAATAEVSVQTGGPDVDVPAARPGGMHISVIA
jgi:hypothetical protein